MSVLNINLPNLQIVNREPVIMVETKFHVESTQDGRFLVTMMTGTGNIWSGTHNYRIMADRLGFDTDRYCKIRTKLRQRGAIDFYNLHTTTVAFKTAKKAKNAIKDIFEPALLGARMQGII